MSDFQEPYSTDFKGDENVGTEKFDEESENSDELPLTNGYDADIKQKSTNLAETKEDVKVNGFANGHGQINGFVYDDEEEYEIDIDPRMDMAMLEPQVDIIEEPDNLLGPPAIPNESPRQQSIFRRKRPIAPKPVSTKVQRRSPMESSGSKRRHVAAEDENSDDRSGCRSLVCDSSGIIIAEMVFKCMICAHISDAISVAHKHYQVTHMSRQSNLKSNAASRAISHSLPHNFDTEDEQDEFDNDLELEASRSRSNYNGTSNHNSLKSVPSNSQQYLESSYSDSLSEVEGGDSEPSILKKPGNFVTAPTPNSYVPGRNSKTNQSILGTNQSSPSSGARGGYVTCAVCNITKYYASVQRRYGQFTCMGCAKFFGRFLLKPKRYFCPNLGSCSLESSPRCKACLLVACINTYVIDEKRMKIVNANRPIKKSASNPPRILPIQDSHPPQGPQITNPNFVVKNIKQESLSFAPPPLVKAPITGMIKMENNNVSLLTTGQSIKSSSVEPRTKRVAVAASPSTINRPNGGSVGRKGTGCRQCANCLSDDCGKCNYCLDKPKFGGPNTLKKKCIKKKCLLVQTGGVPRPRVANK